MIVEMTQKEMEETSAGNIFKNAWGWIKAHVSFKIEPSGATVHT